MAVPADDPRFLRLGPDDNVLVAREDIAAGERVVIGEVTVVLDRTIPRGHKIASRPIGKGEKVMKYGASIGSATAAIQRGEHVHLHNLASDYTASHVIASAAGRTS
jgi:hypothetical protein